MVRTRPLSRVDRYLEWRALFGYCCEHREELESEGRMTAMVFCLQGHWRNMVELKEQEQLGNIK